MNCHLIHLLAHGSCVWYGTFRRVRLSLSSSVGCRSVFLSHVHVHVHFSFLHFQYPASQRGPPFPSECWRDPSKSRTREGRKEGTFRLATTLFMLCQNFFFFFFLVFFNSFHDFVFYFFFFASFCWFFSFLFFSFSFSMSCVHLHWPRCAMVVMPL